MTQYNALNEKLSNSQLSKLKSGMKNGTEATLKLSSNVIGSSNDETNFTYKLLLTNTQISTLRKGFANVLSANIKFSKTQLSKMMQPGGFLSDSLANIVGPLSPIRIFDSMAGSYSKKIKKYES